MGLRGSAFFDNQDFPDCQYSLLIAFVEALREECLLLSMSPEAMLASPNDRTLLRELREVEDHMAKAEIELIDEVDMKLTEDEKISHANAWRSHRETTESLKKSREGGGYESEVGMKTKKETGEKITLEHRGVKLEFESARCF